MIRTFIPYDVNKNIADSYNDCMKTLRKNDWGLFIDRDVLILYPDYIHFLEQKIQQYPDAVMFSCITNRIGYPLQKCKDSNDKSNDINYHVQIANFIRSKKRIATNVTGQLLSGHFMLIHKKYWDKIEITRKGMLGVDNDIFKEMSRVGNVYLLNDFYVYHWYRNGNKKDMKHLL